MAAPRRSWRLALAALVGVSLAGCMVGPNYRPPELEVPANHRGLEGPAEEQSLADVPWWEVFEDSALQDLVREALERNHDLRIAVANVMESRARAGIAESFLYPDVGLFGSFSARDVGDSDTIETWEAGASIAWEVDLFGRIRREKQAAFARYLATEEGRRAVLISLVGQVSSVYFSLLELDLELEIAERTLTLNDETVDFYATRVEGGVSNRLELDQATANRAFTASTIPDIERRIGLTENALSVLLGRLPGPISRGVTLGEQHVPPRLPAGLPATLLTRRPDVIGAEQFLIAANADVGAARALFYPTINLTGDVGGVSSDLTEIMDTDGFFWSLGAGIFQPLFQGGRIRRNYEAAQARFEAALARYEQVALNGYREVADSLITINKLAGVRAEQELGVAALRDAAQLSRSRYDAGLANYLEILIADQQLFQQELLLARTRGSELQALTDLYRALGGGWEQEPGEEPAEPDAAAE